MLYEDEGYVAFSDYRPASKNHFLIIPKQHMEGIRHLKEVDIPVIRELENIGKKVNIDDFRLDIFVYVHVELLNDNFVWLCGTC